MLLWKGISRRISTSFSVAEFRFKIIFDLLITYIKDDTSYQFN